MKFWAVLFLLMAVSVHASTAIIVRRGGGGAGSTVWQETFASGYDNSVTENITGTNSIDVTTETRAEIIVLDNASHCLGYDTFTEQTGVYYVYVEWQMGDDFGATFDNNIIFGLDDGDTTPAYATDTISLLIGSRNPLTTVRFSLYIGGVSVTLEDEDTLGGKGVHTLAIKCYNDGVTDCAYKYDGGAATDLVSSGNTEDPDTVTWGATAAGMQGTASYFVDNLTICDAFNGGECGW